MVLPIKVSLAKRRFRLCAPVPPNWDFKIYQFQADFSQQKGIQYDSHAIALPIVVAGCLTSNHLNDEGVQ